MSRAVKAKSIACRGLAAAFALYPLTVGSNRAMAEEFALRCTAPNGDVDIWEVNETHALAGREKDVGATKIAITARYISWEVPLSGIDARFD